MDCIVLPVVGTAAGGSGWPDTLIVSRKITFFIEFKGQKTKIKNHQTTMMNRLRKKGEIVYVLRYPGLLQEPDGSPICEIPDAFTLLHYMREHHYARLKQ